MIGETIRRIREARRVGLRELARRSGVGVATLARLEAGQGDVKLSTLERVAAALGVPTAALLVPPEEVEAGLLLSHRPGLEVYAWAGVEEVAGRRFVVVWEPSRELGRVYIVLDESHPIGGLLHDAIGYDLEELPAKFTARTPFLRRWGAGPFGTNRPPKELYAAVAREYGFELMPLAGKEELREVWGRKAPPGRL